MLHAASQRLRLVKAKPASKRSLSYKPALKPDLEVVVADSSGHASNLSVLLEEDKPELDDDPAAECNDRGILVLEGFAAMCLYIRAATHASTPRAGSCVKLSDLNHLVLPLHFRAGRKLYPAYLCFNEGTTRLGARRSLGVGMRCTSCRQRLVMPSSS